ncbi:FadR/GntR family transcriptional regulator [Halotalea alkalilenta]|uniref:FadR/GntR family transcriptional regulator n=1 Tax=Halotalea alkalilenta TaxID=376489 RepID=UPI0009ED7ADB|nr:FadR/GntR family transcriptional regulator [Halotalea alkalilenta]
MKTIISVSKEEGCAKTGYEKVVSFLREQLLSGRLKTGDCLLPERELSARLNVSRPVLREALRALAMIGAVEIRHGIGTVVRQPDASTLGEFFSFFLAQHTDVVDDIMEARIAIEHHAIRLACHRARQSDLDELAAALDTIAETIRDPYEGGMADHRFHQAIVRSAHSPVLVSIYESISKLAMRSHLERREKIIEVEGIDEFLIDHHRLIFSAIVAQDVQRADELLGMHFEIGAGFRRRAIMLGAAHESTQVPPTGR